MSSIAKAVAPLLLALLPAVPTGPARAAGADSSALRKECEYGITVAFAGETAQAESVFVSLLSHAPGDARALTNLGNVHFLQGELDVALAFYEWALHSDSADAGIKLNRATTYMMLGDNQRAREEAAAGVKLAGGQKQAASLLGLRSEGGDKPKASEMSARIQLSWSPRKPGQKTRVSKDEIRSLLGTSETAGAAKSETAGDKEGAAGTARPAATAQAGTKAADEGGSNAATLLYWKR